MKQNTLRNEKKKVLRKASSITTEFVKSVEEFIKEFKPALMRLSKS